jgi:hypothetical protein
VESSCERGNEPSGLHKLLGNYRVSKELEERVQVVGGKARGKEATRTDQDVGGWIILGGIL